MLYSTEYREAASRAYLEHIKAMAELMSMLNVELTFAVVSELNESYITSLMDKRDHYEAVIKEASEIIDNLDEVTAEVLRRQYIDCQSINAIADDIGYVERTVHRFARSGREELFDYLPAEYR